MNISQENKTMAENDDSINSVESTESEICLSNNPLNKNITSNKRGLDDEEDTELNESKKLRVSNDSDIEIITLDSGDENENENENAKSNESEPEIIEISDSEEGYFSYKPIAGMLSMRETQNGQRILTNSRLNEQDDDDDIIVDNDKPASNPSKLDKNDLKAHFDEGYNQRITNRNYTYEQQIRSVIEPIFKSMESKPDPDKLDTDFTSPKSLKVSLLPHQIYSIKWLKWRENEPPHGSILADDMGLGKTLTILAYLRSVKDEYERKYKEKNNIKDEENDKPTDKMDEFDAFEYLTKLKKKSKKDDSNVKKLKTLIVLPASLLHQWQGEIENKFEKNAFKVHVYHEGDRKKYSYNLENNDIVFTTYEIISREVTIPDKEGYLPKSDSPLANIKWKRIILDEAHRIKNHSTKANKAMCTLKAKYRVAITGTPVHNSLNDLYSLVKFLHFSPLDDFGLWKYLFSSESISKSLSKENSIQRENRVGFWLKFLSDYLILRRTKKDKFTGTDKCIVDLPEKQIEEVRFRLNETENAIYQKIFKESQDKVNKFLDDHQNRLIGVASGKMSRNNVSEIFVYLLRLRQACCHMSLLAECLDKAELENNQIDLDDESSAKSSYDNAVLFDSDSNDSVKSDYLDSVQSISNEKLSNCLKKSYLSSKIGKSLSMIIDLLNEYPEDKIIVVSQWTSVLAIIASNLKKRDIEYCEIKGDVMLARRNEIVEEFNEKSNLNLRVMLLSLTAGGVGLNLIGANRMFLLDIHWNPALEQQCADRIYRVGQTKNVTVYKLLCEETIEERIQQIQQAKIQIAERVCRSGPESAVPGVPANTRLTIKDFKLLFKDFDTK